MSSDNKDKIVLTKTTAGMSAAAVAIASAAVGYAVGKAQARPVENNNNNNNNNSVQTVAPVAVYQTTTTSGAEKSASAKWKHSRWDHIVVGLGCAGPIIARELLDQGNSVLIIEAGTDHRDDVLVSNVNPVANWKTLTFDPKYAVTYGIPLTNAFDNYAYSEGRGWGGGMMHNYLNAVHGSPYNVYNKWHTASGDSRWNISNVGQLIKELETYTPNGTTADYTVRGQNGPIKISQVSGPISGNAFAIAAKDTFQVTFSDDINNPNLGDCVSGANQRFQTVGLGAHRSYSMLEYLGYDIVDSNGEGVNGKRIKIVSNAYCNKVLFDKHSNKAIGVNFVWSHDGETESIDVFCQKYVTLCTGSFSSPAILERSGIGGAALLTSLDIPVIVDNPNVGQNLNNQYGTFASCQYTSAPTAHQLFTDLKPMHPTDWSTIMDEKKDDWVDKRKVQLIINAAANNTATITAFIGETKSTGSVHISTKDPLVQPSVQMGLWTDDATGTKFGSDAWKAINTLKLIKSIPGVTMVQPAAGAFTADTNLVNYIKSGGGCRLSNHGNRTCKMGQSIVDSVVDGRLNVFGVTGLKIADMSICPTSSDGNNGFNGYVIGKVTRYTY